MVVALNCLRLGDTFDDIIKVNVGEKFVDNDVEIKISEATISDLKMLIWRTKKELNESMKLWKVELEDENKLKDVVTEEDIEKKLNGKKMNPLTKFIDEKNFPVSYKPPHDKVHIIIVVSTTGKCFLIFYLSNKKFAVTKYRVWSDVIIFLSTRTTFVISFLLLYNQKNKL
jgi:hypothetical protein